MLLNRQSPEFDIVLEVMLLIPPEPHEVEIRRIAADLGLVGHVVTKLVESLSERGVRRIRGTKQTGPLATFSRVGYASERARMERYADEVAFANPEMYI